MKGIVNFLKIPGMTSSDAVAVVRKYLGGGAKIKAGHFGTLDPAAAGVLPIGIGKAVRLFDYYLGKRKKYRAGVIFGRETDSGDSFGKVVSSCENTPSKDEILRITPHFIGEIRQIPPQYSAINVNGRRAYEIARSGKTVEIPERTVKIYDIKLLSYDGKNGVFDVECSAGTYIRTLFCDIARRLGGVAYLSYLIRTQSGDFGLGDAVCADELQRLGKDCVIPLETALENVTPLDIDEIALKSIADGKATRANAPDGRYRLMRDGKVVALADVKDEIIKVGIWLWD